MDAFQDYETGTKQDDAMGCEIPKDETLDDYRLKKCVKMGDQCEWIA